MKTAISLPDELFEQVDACAKRLRVTRSHLLAVAARDFIQRQKSPEDATAAWNRAIERAGQPGDDDAAVAFRRLSKRVLGRRDRR